MADVPTRSLPSAEGTNPVEIPEEVPETPTPSVEPKAEETPVGSKTPDNLLYLSLKEERERRQATEKREKELEEKLRSYETVGYTPYVPPEPIAPEVATTLQAVTEKLTQLERRELMRDLAEEFPQIKDKQEEFNEFLQEEANQGLSLSRAAKLFLLEHNLLDTGKPKRKGLESPTSGSREPQTAGMTSADLKRLRENQPRKFAQMLRDGKIKMAEIKE